MNKKVIDVSSYQGDIDWRKVKASGIHGVILKVIRKDLTPDRQFENYWAGCVKAALPIIGVYNYSYATTAAKARTDARKVIEVLGKRKIKVWLDLEDTCQDGLGVTLLEIINSYQKELKPAGLEFGVYTGLSFYNRNLKPYENQISNSFWIARYPSGSIMDMSANPPPNKRPVLRQTLEGWQYTSKGRINGIGGNVDINLWYGELGKSITDVEENPYPVPKKIIRLKTPQVYGDDVKWVQYHLIRLGFLTYKNSRGKSNIDGFFGKDTNAALKAAQTYFGITADGIVGPITTYILKNN